MGDELFAGWEWGMKHRTWNFKSLNQGLYDAPRNGVNQPLGLLSLACTSCPKFSYVPLISLRGYHKSSYNNHIMGCPSSLAGVPPPP
jgi:hypothetical protein